MSAAGYRFSLMLCCLLLMGFCARSVLADDIDVIKARLQKDDVGSQPQVLIIFDNSGSMADTPSGENPNNCYYRSGCRSKMTIARDVVKRLIDENADINFGLAVFNNNGNTSLRSECYSYSWWGTLTYSTRVNSPECWRENGGDDGGRVVFALPSAKKQSSGSRLELKNRIDNLTPETSTPLCETLFEVYRYFSGSRIEYGYLGGNGAPRRDYAAEEGNRYRSPLRACQSVYIIYMTDGQPQWDLSANEAIRQLTGEPCDKRRYPWAAPYAGYEAYPAANCLPVLTHYMHTHDLAPDLPGAQHAYTYTIGFATDQTLLRDAASPLLDAEGGDTGQKGYFTVEDTPGLTSAFDAIVGNIRQQQTLNRVRIFASDFNQLRNLDNAYVPVFQPRLNAPWTGNLKKYAYHDDTLSDSESWTGSRAPPDEVERGGAGALLAEQNDRRLYSDIGSSGGGLRELTSNTAVIGSGLAGNSARQLLEQHRLTLSSVAQWLRTGRVDGQTALNRVWPLADIIHSRPLAFNRGCPPDQGICRNSGGITLFVGSNDGLLHAFDAETGRETWSFWPQEVIDAPVFRLFNDNAVYQARYPGGTDGKHDVLVEEGSQGTNYGIDGSPALLAVDGNDNGYIGDDPDQAILAFGFRRGGYGYYGLDVKDPARPREAWRISTADSGFEWLGQSWSTPRPALIASEGNRKRRVFLFGGGYDRRKDDISGRSDGDTQAVDAIERDTRGAGFYVIDASTGALVGAFEQHLNHPELQDSIAGDMTTVDADGDGVTEGAFFADTGGNVWFADLRASNPDQWRLVNVAQLGRHDTPRADRRFFTAPELIRTRLGDVDFDFLVVASGDRAHLRRNDTNDAIFVLNVTPVMAGGGREVMQWPLGSNDLIRATSTSDDQQLVLPESVLRSHDTLQAAATGLTASFGGWQIPMGTRRKALSESRTVLGVTFMTAYDADDEGTCTPLGGKSVLYGLVFPELEQRDSAGAGQVYVQRSNGRVVSASIGSTLVDELSLHVDSNRIELSGAGRATLAKVLSELNGITLTQSPLTPTWWYQQDP